MPFEKGESGNPAGRPKGSRNRSTSTMREAMALLIDENLDRMSEWLDDIAKDDPKAAFQCMLSLLEFHMPKMSRVTWIDEVKEAPQSSKEELDEFLQAIEQALDREIASGKIPTKST